MANSKVLSVLIVDDSNVYRRLLVEVANGMPNLNIVGEAVDGYDALSKINQIRPDIVLLDVEMPRMDGLATLRRISRRYPEIGVIMVSGTNRKAADITMEALQNGALDFVSKPKTTGFDESSKALKDALIPIFELVRNSARKSGAASVTPERAAVPSIQRASAASKAPVALAERQSSKRTPSNVSMVLVGISTGGPAALAKLIPSLPGDLRAPILIVQHMPEGFTKSLASQLDVKSSLTVKEGEEGDIAEAGTVYIAPGGKHMIVRSKDKSFEIGLNNSPPVNSCRPSVDVLFTSAAGITKGSILTLIMTGMGNDGTAGLRTLSKYNTFNLAQDEVSCTVYGMPRSVVEGNLADEVLPLDRLASRVAEIVQGRAGK